MKRVISAALAVMMATSSIAFAAQSVAVIQGVGGKVLVNKGEGFVPALDTMQLSVGDSVMVGDESSATLAFGECSVLVSKPTVITVTAQAPCAGSEGAFVTPTADVSEVAAPFPWPLLALLGGGAAVVTVIAVTKNKKSVSP
jgi:hypothetical protein